MTPPEINASLMSLSLNITLIIIAVIMFSIYQSVAKQKQNTIVIHNGLTEKNCLWKCSKCASSKSDR